MKNTTFRLTEEEARHVRAFVADLRATKPSADPFVFFESENRFCAIHIEHPMFEAKSVGTHAEFCDGENTNLVPTRWIGAKPESMNEAMDLMKRLGESASRWRTQNT